MNELLNPVRTTTTSDIQRAHDQLVAVPPGEKRCGHVKRAFQSPEDALEVLQSKPDLDLLIRVLQWLDQSCIRNDQFNIKVPGPKATPILFVLVENIIPDYWRHLKDGNSSEQDKQVKLIVRCLSSIAGIGVIITRLRILLDRTDEAQSHSKSEGNGKDFLIADILDVLQHVAQKDKFLLRIWKDNISLITNIPQRNMMWKELISSVAAGRILSLAGEADHILNKSSASIKDRSWIGDGNQYAAWLGRNIAHMITTLEPNDTEAEKALARLLDKALKLGYTGERSGLDGSVVSL